MKRGAYLLVGNAMTVEHCTLAATQNGAKAQYCHVNDECKLTHPTEGSDKRGSRDRSWSGENCGRRDGRNKVPLRNKTRDAQRMCGRGNAKNEIISFKDFIHWTHRL